MCHTRERSGGDCSTALMDVVADQQPGLLVFRVFRCLQRSFGLPNDRCSAPLPSSERGARYGLWPAAQVPKQGLGPSHPVSGYRRPGRGQASYELWRPVPKPQVPILLGMWHVPSRSWIAQVEGYLPHTK